MFATPKIEMRSALMAGLLFGLASCGSTQQVEATEPAQTSISAEGEITVTILGSGTPAPSATQFGTAILVQAGSQNLMFDCGRGCTTRLAQVDPSLIAKVDRLFISHLHSDHIVGVDDLWLNGWTQGRKNPLKIFGPVGTADFMKHLRSAFGYDIDIRFSHGVPSTMTGLNDDITELTEDGVVFRQDGVEVTAFLVDHASVKPAWGYRIDYLGRSVMISGDTGPTENLYTYGAGTDLLLQEVMSPALIDYIESIFDERQVARIVSYHTTAVQAADIFKETSPRLAVYYHTRNDGDFASSLIDETRTIYDGPLEVGHDLFQIEIGDEIVINDLRPTSSPTQ